MVSDLARVMSVARARPSAARAAFALALLILALVPAVHNPPPREGHPVLCEQEANRAADLAVARGPKTDVLTIIIVPPGVAFDPPAEPGVMVVHCGARTAQGAPAAVSAANLQPD